MLVLTPYLQLHRLTFSQAVAAVAVVAAAVVEAAVVVAAAAAQDPASALANRTVSTLTQPAEITSITATREIPTLKIVLMAWFLITTASAATGFKQSRLNVYSNM